VQLSRCEIRAPFAGRVVEKKADVGQYVSPGMVLASVYAIDVAEVRLPLSQQQIKLLDLPPVIATQDRRDDVAVRLTGQANGKTHHWESRIVRTEATIDERNRLQYVVAQVDDPYGLEPRGSQQNNATRPALPTGLFVEAEIEGRLLQDVYVLPRLAIHNTDKVWLLDQQQRLRIRNVKLVHRGEDKAYVSEGLAPGDTLIVSPLDAVVDGMRVRVQDAAVGVMTNRE
jgi:RND family efflux transporter MFP subunit